MTSPTGEIIRSGRPNRGITFIEVMVTAVILSAGLVALYRSFFIGVDYLDYLSHRLSALDLIQARVAAIERDFRVKADVDIGPLQETRVLNGRQVEYTFNIQLKPVENLLTVFQLDLQLSWAERGRTVSISRSAYFSSVNSVRREGGG